MSLRLRLRGPSGGATINVPAGASAASLEALVREALGLGADGTVELLGGHPPKPICASPDGTPLISSGDTLVVRLTTQDGSKRHCAEPEPTPTPAAPAVPDSAGLTCAACTFLNSSQQAACEVCGAPLRGGGAAHTHTAAPAPIPPAVSAADQASIRSASRVDPIEREAARRKAMEAVLATAELVLPPGCKPAPAPVVGPVVTGGPPSGDVEEDGEDEDAMLARAIALSQSGDFGGDFGGGGGGGGGGDGDSFGGGGGGGGGGDGGGEQLVRRVVPADNSCLFVALALALEGGDRTRARRPSNPAPAPDSGPDSGPSPSPDSGPDPDPDSGPDPALTLTLALTRRAAALREVVASAVLADPERFNEAVLGRLPQE